MGMYIGPQKWWTRKRDRSLRFNSADSAYLSRTPATAGNRKTWTWAGWVKRSNLSGELPLLHTPGNSNDSAYFRVYITGDQLACSTFNSSGGIAIGVVTSQVFRDASAWMHIQVALDTTQATPSDRLKLYVNGVQVTEFSSSNWPTQNTDYGINTSGLIHYIGLRTDGINYANGYLADVHFIDGQALDPTEFGEFDSNGIWQAKTYYGTYGQNGFYLDFNDNTSTSTLGKDISGRGNDWTANNFSVDDGAGNDSVIDVPTNEAVEDTGVGGEVRGNYCTLNPLSPVTSYTLANGNLDVSFTGYDRVIVGTFGMSSGKWYWEYTQGSSGTNQTYGILESTATLAGFGGGTGGYCVLPTLSRFYANGSFSTYGSSLASGDILGVAFDADTGTLTFYKNGSSLGTASSSIPSGTYLPSIGNAGPGTNTAIANFGQRPFAHQAPEGFKALCTTNLPAPTIEDPSTVMDVKLYTGNGTSQTISGLEFSPDLVWIKNRVDSGINHRLFDFIRGATNQLFSNLTDAELTLGTSLTAFNSNGFSVGSNNGVNGAGDAIVAWTWDAGSSTVTNTDGSITSSVRANPSAGFSIVTYTGTGANATVGHGLGVAPSLLICKGRQESGSNGNWLVYHSALGNTKYLVLNTTDAQGTNSGAWNNTSPTSTTFSIGTFTGANSTSGNICYAFAPVAGYSAFGSYTGNGSADGPFVYTGQRSRWILLKNASSAGSNWYLFDTARDTYNVAVTYLLPNSSAAESTATFIDICSNGFKVRNAGGDTNGNGNTIVYACFAENPFQYARAR